jgi:hypothetical protein
MQTSGHGNDALMILVPVGVLVIAGIILFGGPEEALDAVNAIVGEAVTAAVTAVSTMF